jgi:hypothetical protein
MSRYFRLMRARRRERRSLGMFGNFGAVAGEDAGGGVDVVLGVIDGGAGFAEAGGDELELAGISGGVAGGVDTRTAAAHRRIHRDGDAMQLYLPIAQRAGGTFETDVDQNRIHIERLLVFASIVIDNDLLDMPLARNGFELVESEDVHGRVMQFFDRSLVSSKRIAAMDERDGIGDTVERVGPIDGTIAAADDEEIFAAEIFGTGDRVINSAALEVCSGFDIQPLGLKRPDAGGDEDRAGEMFLLICMQRIEALFGIKIQSLHALAEAEGWLMLHRLRDKSGDEILGKNFWKSRHVIDEFFGIERGELSTEDGEGVDDFDGHAAEASVESAEQAGRAAADDDEIRDWSGWGHLVWKNYPAAGPWAFGVGGL